MHSNDQVQKPSSGPGLTIQTLLTRQDTLQNTVCAPGIRQSVQMDRVDGGVGESSTNMHEGSIFPSRDSNQMQKYNLPLLDSPQQPGLNSSTSNTSTLPTSTRPTITQRHVARRSSGTRGSHRGSTPPSRRSSFAAPQPVNSYNRRPLFPNRSISAAYGRSLGEDPFLVHRRSKQLFQNLETPQLGQFPIRPEDRKPLVSPSLPNLARVPSTVVTTEQGFAISQAEESNPDSQHQYANHVPATVIDWTLPSTRRLEYREIDKSCQGLRGLWRRLAPRWCRRNSRLCFFDGNDSDTGSVRRYRLDLPAVEKENKADSVDIKEQEIEVGLGKSKRRWSCRGFWD